MRVLIATAAAAAAAAASALVAAIVKRRREDGGEDGGVVGTGAFAVPPRVVKGGGSLSTAKLGRDHISVVSYNILVSSSGKHKGLCRVVSGVCAEELEK